ncbi:MAG: carbonic anhydrase [Bacilli bacterium]|nr:carbonic anhydrase [Bacilli bacterium]
MKPFEQLQALLEANKEIADSGIFTGGFRRQNREKAVKEGQHPKAIVVSCSDSRVIPELIFNCGVGDLFVIRTAGEVVSDVELASIAYGIEHLGIELVIVLGHDRCGAVAAAINGELEGAVAPVTNKVNEAIGDTKSPKIGELRNVQFEAEVIKEKLGLKDTNVLVAPALYDIASGLVELR